MNKGSPEQPMIKARLVAKELREKTLADEMLSGTPCLSGVRMLLSDLAINNAGRIAMIADITGALLYGKVTRYVCVELPPETKPGATR